MEKFYRKEDNVSYIYIYIYYMTPELSNHDTSSLSEIKGVVQIRQSIDI